MGNAERWTRSKYSTALSQSMHQNYVTFQQNQITPLKRQYDPLSPHLRDRGRPTVQAWGHYTVPIRSCVGLQRAGALVKQGLVLHHFPRQRIYCVSSYGGVRAHGISTVTRHHEYTTWLVGKHAAVSQSIVLRCAVVHHYSDSSSDHTRLPS